MVACGSDPPQCQACNAQWDVLYRGPDLGDFGTKTYAPGAVTGVETVGFRSNAPAGPTRL